MCQQYENEKEFVIQGELSDIKKAWERHKSGEHVLTEDELLDLAVRKFMLEER